MDPDQARYYCARLRALADLLIAGEPVCWIERVEDAGASTLRHITVVVAGEQFGRAVLAVRKAVWPRGTTSTSARYD